MGYVKWTKHQYFIESEFHKISVSHGGTLGERTHTLWQKNLDGVTANRWKMVKIAPLLELKKFVHDYH